MFVDDEHYYCDCCYNYFESCDCIDSFDVDGLPYPEDNSDDDAIDTGKENEPEHDIWYLKVPNVAIGAINVNLGKEYSIDILTNKDSWTKEKPSVPSAYLAIPSGCITKDPWDLDWSQKSDTPGEKWADIFNRIMDNRPDPESMKKPTIYTYAFKWMGNVMKDVLKDFNPLDNMLDSAQAETIRTRIEQDMKEHPERYQVGLEPYIGSVPGATYADKLKYLGPAAVTLGLIVALNANPDMTKPVASLTTDFKPGKDYFWLDASMEHKNPTTVYNPSHDNYFVDVHGNLTSDWKQVYDDSDLSFSNPSNFSHVTDRDGNRQLLAYDNPIVKKDDTNVDSYQPVTLYKVNLTSNLDTTGWLKKVGPLTVIIPLGLTLYQTPQITINGQPAMLTDLLNLDPNKQDLNVDIQIKNTEPIIISNINVKNTFAPVPNTNNEFSMTATDVQGFTFLYWEKPDGTRIDPFVLDDHIILQNVDNNNKYFKAIYRPDLIVKVYIDGVYKSDFSKSIINNTWNDSNGQISDVNLNIDGYTLDSYDSTATIVTNFSSVDLSFQASYKEASLLNVYLLKTIPDYNLTFTSNVPESLLLVTKSLASKNTFVVNIPTIVNYDLYGVNNITDNYQYGSVTSQTIAITTDTVVDLVYRPQIFIDSQFLPSSPSGFNDDNLMPYDIVKGTFDRNLGYNVSLTIKSLITQNYDLTKWTKNGVVQSGNNYNFLFTEPLGLYFYFLNADSRGGSRSTKLITLTTSMGYPQLTSGTLNGSANNGTSLFLIDVGDTFNCSVNLDVSQLLSDRFMVFGYTVNGVYFAGQTYSGVVSSATTVVADVGEYNVLKVQPSTTDIPNLTWSLLPAPYVIRDLDVDENVYRKGTNVLVTIVVTNTSKVFSGWTYEDSLYDKNPRNVLLDVSTTIRPALINKILFSSYYNGTGAISNLARGRTIVKNDMPFYIHHGGYCNSTPVNQIVDGLTLPMAPGMMFYKNTASPPYCPIVAYVKDQTELRMEPQASSLGTIGSEFTFTVEPPNAARDNNFSLQISVGYYSNPTTYCTQISNGSWDATKETSYGITRTFSGRGPHTVRYYLPANLGSAVYNKAHFIRVTLPTEPTFLCFESGCFIDRPRNDPLIPSRFGVSQINTPISTYVPARDQYMMDHDSTAKYFMKCNLGANSTAIQNKRKVWKYPNWNNETGMVDTTYTANFGSIPTRGYEGLLCLAYQQTVGAGVPGTNFRTRIDNADGDNDKKNYDSTAMYICGIHRPNNANMS